MSPSFSVGSLRQKRSTSDKTPSHQPVLGMEWGAIAFSAMEPQEKVNRKGGRTSLVVQWLRIHASTAGRMCSTPGQETKIHIPSSVAKKPGSL